MNASPLLSMKVIQADLRGLGFASPHSYLQGNVVSFLDLSLGVSSAVLRVLRVLRGTPKAVYSLKAPVCLFQLLRPAPGT